ncbi:bifunctional biotin--[acetyl-CoA-carboxylase] ligase/biotin operon repressor BirA [Ferrimonas gelatinilytica]|uniref:Bifunctional ligase/repressor BirA n=1 Tax=Ferrimonas gelatinilytica TaxID=1255257 RepID=A0ABP9SCM1_9GAMM
MVLSDARKALIEILADGQFYSGSVLAERLGVSRAAIHNHMAALAELGLEVHRVKGRGYRLSRPLSLLEYEGLSANRDLPVHLFWQLGSTNDFLLKRRHLCVNGESCLAEMQTQGRGRRGREWVSPLGCHLYLSYFWRFERGMLAVAGLSLAVGVLLAESLETLGVKDVRLKWPNDLYRSGRKLGGILIEMHGQMGEPCELVIGAGINISMPEGAAVRIDQPWIDLADDLPDLDRTALACRVLAHLDQGLGEFEQSGLKTFVERWRQRDQYADKPVQLLMGERKVVGVARGIDEGGNVLIALPDGQLKAFGGGEISLRADS